MVRVVVVLLVLGSVAWADCPHVGKQLSVARGTPTVDGVLDDAVWQHACFASDFEQKTPVFGAPPTRPLEVAVAIDNTTLYIGARMHADSATDVDDALTQHDDTRGAERFIVSIDPSHTKRLAYSFAVTARGVRADWLHTDDNENARDASWDPVWFAKSKILADGWSVEMAIPLSQLRLPREPSASWGINFDWYIPRRTEDVFWRAVPADRTAWASYFGELVDLPPVRRGVNLELMPYVAVRGQVDEARVVYPAKRALFGIEGGLDAKLRPLPGLTINATVNPDFAQVNADPSFVNLTAYEVQLPELRPFFVANQSILNDSNDPFFYSRRIGGLPLAQPLYDAADLPTYVRILGAAAVGGNIAPHTQIAAITAVSDQASADAVVDGARTSLVVSPLTAWGVGRVEQQVDASVLGASATIVERAAGSPLLQAILAQSAIAGGVDGTLRTADRQWELDPYFGGSGLFGTAAAITSIEENSTHYFQRPDQPHVHVDDDAHHLLGWDGGISAQRRAGEWRPGVQLQLQSPGFDLNDAGMLPDVDNIAAVASLGRYVTTPTEHVFAWNAGLLAIQRWNFGGAHKPSVFRANYDLTLSSFYRAGASLLVVTPGEDDALSRGGPLVGVGWRTSSAIYANTPDGRANQLSARVNVYQSATLQQGVVASVTLATRLTPALRLDVAPVLTLVETHRQYVDTVVDPEADMTYGSRYIFGHLIHKEASVVLRATWSLSPDLVMTLYAQPFISTSRYDALGELAAAGSDQIRWYGQTARDPTSALRTIVDGPTAFTVPEPDFTIASLRSTAVLRWEFRPGSTLYVVWQQQRGGVAVPVERPLHTASPEILTDSAIHTIAVKLSYWFG